MASGLTSLLAGIAFPLTLGLIAWAGGTPSSEPLGPVTKHEGCAVRMSNGYPIPDPDCTPGAINPQLTVEKLRDPHFRTTSVRNQTTSEAEKASTYRMYGIPHPAHNTGASQTCELDHLVSLELGGADTLDNIWPQCGPAGGEVLQGTSRYFKVKDLVENWLAQQVKSGRMNLPDAQHAIASDWTQFVGEVSR